MIDNEQTRLQPHHSRPPIETDSPDHLVDAADDTVLVASRQTWSGPLPPPAMLAGYNDAVAGGAERILSMVENQNTHRMKMESVTLAGDQKLAERGQWIGLIVVIAVLLLAAFMAYLGATAMAAAVVAIDIVGLAAIFIYGSIRNRVVREIQVEDGDVIVERPEPRH